MYHVWAACSAIAAALQRRCWMKWGHDTIYPNLYVVLVGPSGKVRKGDPINIAKMFVKDLMTPMIGEENSPEYVARFMAEAIQTYTDRTTGRIEMHSSVTCFVEELSVLTGERNTRFLATLTNWYDCRSDWTRGTKNAGVDDVKGVWLNMLAATAPDWLPYIFTKEAVGGGFTSRCIFVVEDRLSQVVSDPNSCMPSTKLRNEMKFDLEIMKNMSGEFCFTEDGHKEYVEWYENFQDHNLTGNDDVKDAALQGYASRRPTHLKKLSMIMSAARGCDYMINAADFRRAKTLLEVTEKRMSSVFDGIGSARYVRETDTILNYIRSKGSCTKADVLRQYYRMLDVYTLDNIVSVLEQMGAIKRVLKDGSTTYTSLKRDV